MNTVWTGDLYEGLKRKERKRKKEQSVHFRNGEDGEGFEIRGNLFCYATFL